MTHLEFLRDRFGGSNWVIARRTKNILTKYGAGVICLTHKQYAAAERSWRLEHGHDYPPSRAAMYLALKALCAKHAAASFQGDPYTFEPEWQAALDALKAEESTF